MIIPVTFTLMCVCVLVCVWLYEGTGLRDGAGCERSQRARREWRRQRRERWTRVFSSRITEESETERCGKERKWSGNSERCVKVSRWFCVYRPWRRRPRLISKTVRGGRRENKMVVDISTHEREKSTYYHNTWRCSAAGVKGQGVEQNGQGGRRSVWLTPSVQLWGNLRISNHFTHFKFCFMTEKMNFERLTDGTERTSTCSHWLKSHSIYLGTHFRGFRGVLKQSGQILLRYLSASNLDKAEDLIQSNN